MSNDSRDSDGGTLPDETHVGRAALRVADHERTVEFYRAVVGLSILETESTRSILGTETKPLLVVEDGSDRAGRAPDETGLFHNAFRVPSRGALGDVLGRIRNRWELDGAADHGVSEALYLSDPEGNGVEVYRDFPDSEWPVDADGTLRMVTDPLDLDAMDTGATGADSVPAATDVGHVHLEVSSLSAFEEFYVDVLGFEIQQRAPGVVFVSAGGYHHHVGANTWNRRTKRARGMGLSWFELVVPTADALDAIGDRARSRGLSVGTFDDPGSGIELTDPDGIAVRVRVGAVSTDA